MFISKISSDKNTIFSSKQSINCKGKLISLNKPLVMGILNITEDSFFDGGKHNSEKTWLKQTEKMLTEGADIIDIGAASTRPGARLIPVNDEIKTIKTSLQSIRKEFPETIISIDTYYSKVAEIAVNEGADMINDISGGDIDKEMFETIAKLKVPYIFDAYQRIARKHATKYKLQ